MFKNILILGFVFIGLVSLNAQTAKDTEILNAMRSEMKRSMSDLVLDGLKKPYYIEYRLRVRNLQNIKAVLGSVVDSDNNDIAVLNVGVRVGDYQFDNSNFFDIGLSFFGSSDDEESFKSRSIAIEFDYNTLRRELWLATDAAYKQSAEIFSKKEASLKNRMRKDTTSDFIVVAPQKNYKYENAPSFDTKYFNDLVKSMSAVFLGYPEISSSSVGVEYLPELVYYVNSEGMEYIRSDYYAGLEVAAFSQAKDGMPLTDFFTTFTVNPKDFPSRDSLMNAAKNVAQNLTKILNASQLDEPYSGPVLFTEQAAAELVAQVFAPNLVTQRATMTEGGSQPNERNTAFQSKIGGRVMSEFLSVKDSPDLKKYENTNLLGYYKIDDDGVLAENVPVVENGYLKYLLSERIPTRRVRNTNGHRRGGAAMFSNIVVDVQKDKQKDYKELKERLIKLCKDRELPYGIIVKKIMNTNLLYTTIFRLPGNGFQMPRGSNVLPVTEAYKVYPDGREELIRGVEARGLSAQSFKDIIEAGKSKYAYNFLAGSVISSFITGGDQYIGSSIITPDLLFEDAEVKAPDDDFKKPPILSSPLLK